MAAVANIDQIGIDISVKIFDPNNNLILEVDSLNGKNGLEKVDFTTNISGIHQFLIEPTDYSTLKGKYILEVDSIFSLTDNQKRIYRKELPSQTLYNLWEASIKHKSAIDNFVNQHPQHYIIEAIKNDKENMLVTYFCRPGKDIEYVMLSGGPDFLGLRFKRLPGTQLFYVTQKVPRDARFDFGFNYFKLHKFGPNGEIESRSVSHVYDGHIEMFNAPKQKYIVKNSKVEEGKILVAEIKSKFLNESRTITVHTPANYNPKTSHNLLIIFDGESYGGRKDRPARIPTPTIMDNLHDSGLITPTITILVWNLGKRSRDLISDDFSSFIVDELLSWAKSNYNIPSKPDNIILAGSSRGAFAASYIAFNHPDKVGNVLSQSGAYWIKGTKDENHWTYPKDNGKLIDLYLNSPRLPLTFYLDAGLYEAGASGLGMNRQFRDILISKGYSVDYREFKGGHNYSSWRGTLSDGIISLIGIKNN